MKNNKRGKKLKLRKYRIIGLILALIGLIMILGGSAWAEVNVAPDLYVFYFGASIFSGLFLLFLGLILMF